VDATQFFSLTTPISSAAGESAVAVPPAKVEGRGAEFADLFKAQIQLQLRQEFAAPAADELELQVLPLGPTINLITSNTPLPDMFSLASFARAQGLDDEAVQTLFGQAPIDEAKKPVILLEISDQLRSDIPFDPFYLGSAQSIPMPVIAERMDAKAVVTTGLMTTVGTSPFLGLSSTVANLGAAKGTLGHLKADIEGLKAAKVAENMANATLSSAAGKLDAKIVSLEIGVLPAPVKIGSSTPIAPIMDENGVDIANGVLRLRLDAPSEAITQKLAQISGAKEPLNWNALLVSANGASISKVEISTQTELLALEVPKALLAELEDTSADGTGLAFTPTSVLSGDSARATSPAGSSGAMDQNSSSEHRNEQFQQVADRLGRAVAERLMAQIERGEWKMQLRLQPESLGRIDVALEMHGGGLDALFSAENGVTRDLIAQGAAKLRDALMQSGMAVASVLVNGDQGRKSDGNPTSGRSFKGGTGAAKDDEVDVIAVPRAGSRISSSADGLDVLA
jgi:hypothetical protein